MTYLRALFFCTITLLCFQTGRASALINPGGTATANDTIVCYNNNTLIQLTGYTGTIIWQTSPDGVTWTDSTITTASFLTKFLTTPRYYRAKVTDGVIVSFSNPVRINVYPQGTIINGGTISGTNPLCQGTLLTLSGYVGVVVRWESCAASNFTPGTVTQIANTTDTFTAPDLAIPMYYRARVKLGNCDSTFSEIITIDPATSTSVGGTVSGGGSFCISALAASLVLTGNTGNVIRWESSPLQDFSSNVQIISHTLLSYGASLASPGTLYYRALVKNGSCDSAYSSVDSVIILPASVGGTVSGTSPFSPNIVVCAGTNSSDLILSGYTGTIIKWQSSLTSDFSGTITDIANTSDAYTATNLTATTYYRVVVQNELCASAFSSVKAITVIPLSVGGIISGDTTVCTGTNSTTLILSGNVGSVLKWQSSFTSDFSGTVTDIANTSDTLTVIDLTATTYYRTVVQNDSCASAFSSVKVITVNPLSVSGKISGDTTVCTGTNSTTLILSGNVGSILKWQSSLTSDFSGTITDISNTTTILNAGNLTATTFYRTIIQSGVCSADTTDVAAITVEPLSVGGTVLGNDTVCSGTNSTTLTLSGHIGSIIKWQSAVFPNFAGIVTDIADTTTSLSVTDLTETTYFRAVVQSGNCVATNSTTATVTVISPTIGGMITGGANTVCYGNNSTTLTLINYTGTILRWESSTINTFDPGTITIIPDTTSSLTVTDITSATFYRAIVQHEDCAPASSTVTHIQIYFLFPIPGTISGPASVCINSNNATLTLSGHDGAIVRWESSETADFSGTITNIANTATTLNITNLAVTTYYRVLVTKGPLNCELYSDTLEVSVTPNVVGGTITGSTTVCSGFNSTQLTLSGYTGNIVKWQSSTTSDFSGIVTDITNTTDTYTATNLTATTYYRVVITLGTCLSHSSTTNISIDPLSTVAGSISGGQTVCAGINNTTLTLSGNVGTIIKWQSSINPDFSSSTDIGNTTSTLVINNLTEKTYYRVIVQSGVCPADTTSIDSIIAGSVYEINNPQTICQGEVYTFNGNNYSIEGTYRDTLLTQLNCDSIIITELTINPVYQFNNPQTICQGGVYAFNGNNYSIEGTYRDTLLTQLNCDSIIITELTINPVYQFNNPQTICQGEVYTFNGHNYSVAGTYRDTLLTQLNCDSIIVTLLTLDSIARAGVLSGADTFCTYNNNALLILSGSVGEIIKWQSSTSPDFSANVIDTLTNASSLSFSNINISTYYRVIVQNGVCDPDTSNTILIHIVSAINSNNILQPVPVSFYDSIDPDTIYGSYPLGGTGIYQYIWQSSTLGSDTVFIDIPASNVQNLDPSAINQTTWYRRIVISSPCKRDTSNVVFLQKVEVPSHMNIRIGSALRVNEPVATAPGTYELKYTIRLVNMSNVPLNKIQVKENLAQVFPPPANFSLTGVSGGLPMNPSFDGINDVNLLDPELSNLSVGENVELQLRISVTPNLPNVTYYNKIQALAYAQMPDTNIHDFSVDGNDPDPNGDGTPDEESYTEVSLAIFIPSGYSPNNDGKNDAFVIKGIEQFPNNRLEIYNRWGNKVYQKAPYDNSWKGNTENTGGLIIGDGLLPSGTYFYLLDFGIEGVNPMTGYIVIRK